MLTFRKYLQLLAVIPLAFGYFLDPGNQIVTQPASNRTVLSQHEMSLSNRYQNSFVNDIFKKNILLNLAYLSRRVTNKTQIKWGELTQPFQYEFRLNPDKTFAYHEDVKQEYQEKIEKTTNTHFNASEGFKTDGYLFGDGVCHLASLINWAAKEAGLLVEAPTKHDFAPIPDVPKEYGVSIYSNPGFKPSNALQNLYITNNKNKPIAFRFSYQDNKVTVSIVELN